MSDSSVSGDSSSSKSLMWMMIALFVGLGLLLSGGLFMASRVVRTLGLSAASSQDTIKTPGGSFRTEKEEQVGPALPVYPRSALVIPSSDDAGIELKNRQNGVQTVTYQTSDIRDLVDSWYLKHLGQEFTRHDAGEKPTPDFFSDARVSDSDIAFFAQRGKMVRVVALSLDADGTKISLVRFEKQAAP